MNTKQIIFILLFFHTTFLYAQHKGGSNDGFGVKAYCSSTLNGTTTPLVINSIAGASSVCNNTNEQYQIGIISGKAEHYYWTGTTGFTIQRYQGISPVLVTIPTSGNIKVSVSNSCGEVSKSKAITVVSCGINKGGVNDGFAMAVKDTIPLTSCGVVATAGNDTAICKGETITLTASGGIAYKWNTGDSAASVTVSPDSTTTYSVSVYNDSCYNIATITVTVDSMLPAAITGTSAVCPGDSTTLTATPAGKYQWNTGDTTDSITVTPDTNTTYSVTITNGACSDTASMLVSVSAANATIIGTTTICTGESTTLTASGGASYLWSTADTTASITTAPPKDSTYFVTVSITGSCSYTDTLSISVTVSPPPTATINGTTAICSGDSTTLTASGGNNYVWNSGDTTSAITVYPSTSQTYTVTVSVGSCSDTTSIEITTKPLPTAEAGTDISIELGDSIPLTALGGTIYSWTPVSGLDNPNSATPLAFPENTTVYYVTVTDANGCSAIDSVKITVSVDCGEPFIPSAFSPNNDGYNDELLVRSKPNCFKEFLFEIYNRWGQKVFSTTDQNEGWKGTLANEDKEMNTAVFVYYVKVKYKDDTTKIYKGNVTMVK